MLQLSAKLEYALLALIELAKHFESRKMTGVKEIAIKQNIPDRYLDQILTELKRAGITESLRGARGGHRLSRRSKEITLGDIVKGLEPDKPQTGTVQISPSQMAIVTLWAEAAKDVELVLHKITLEEFCQVAQNYEQCQIMYYI
jgi:Rrf2 family protein